MPVKQSLSAFAIALACSFITVPPAAFSQSEAVVQQPELCELKIEGHSILSLTLIRMGDASGPVAGEKHLRPGKSLQLPAGRYYVESVELEGEYQATGPMPGEEQWFELARDKSSQLVIGAPLSPSVSVTRHGKFLEMDYQLVDAAGRSYTFVGRNVPRPEPPRFTVYQDGQVLGSDSFDYG